MRHQGGVDLERLTSRDFLAIARALTMVEDGSAAYGEWWSAIQSRLGGAFIVGLTGWPGVGKSTLMGRLLEHVDNDDEYVGVVAVDPSSHRTGGAVLGDRLRMMSTVMKPNIFVRSLASRGDQSGVSKSTLSAVDVMDAAGFDWIFIETVGVGQTQVDILELADVVVLVTAPGLGDEVQAIKAGILEIPDIIVVNMADRPGANRTVSGLRWALGHNSANRGRIIPTVALHDGGVEELWNGLRALRDERQTPLIANRKRWRNRRRALVFADEIWAMSMAGALQAPGIGRLLTDVENGRCDPREAGIQIIETAQQILVQQGRGRNCT